MPGRLQTTDTRHQTVQRLGGSVTLRLSKCDLDYALLKPVFDPDKSGRLTHTTLDLNSVKLCA